MADWPDPHLPGTTTGTGSAVLNNAPTLLTPIIDNLNLTGKILAYGGVAPTDGQLIIGKTSSSTFEAAALTGTTNQITVTNGAGTITLAGPLNLHTGATPQFTRLGISTAADATHLLLINSGTVTADTHLLDLVQTWNSGGVTFTALKLNVTSSASAAASKLVDLQLAGTPAFTIDKN